MTDIRARTASEQAVDDAAAAILATMPKHRTTESVGRFSGNMASYWWCACGQSGGPAEGAKQHQAHAVILALIDLGWSPAPVIEGETVRRHQLTSHGHPCCDAIDFVAAAALGPTAAARCGGQSLCGVCRGEADLIHEEGR